MTWREDDDSNDNDDNYDYDFMIMTTSMKMTVVCRDDGNRVAAAVSADVHDNDDPETILAMTAMAIGRVADVDGAGAVVIVVVDDDYDDYAAADDDDDVHELLW